MSRERQRTPPTKGGIYLARNYYYPRRQQEPKIKQVVTLPEYMRVMAKYRTDSGEIESERVFLLGLFDDGETRFLSPDGDGFIEPLEYSSCFVGYQIEER